MPVDYADSKIYTIVNDVNDTIYVGSTAQKRLCSRMVNHRRDSLNPKKTSGIHTAMRTIGPDRFTITLHHTFPCNNKDELVAEEMKTLDTLVAAGKAVYNNRTGTHGWTLTDETKKKLAAAHRGKVLTSEHKDKIAKGVQAVVKVGEKNAQFNFGSLRLSTIGTAPPQRWFSYRTPEGVAVCRAFSCKKYGYEQAKLLAEKERKKVYPAWKPDEETEEEREIDDAALNDLDDLASLLL